MPIFEKPDNDSLRRCLACGQEFVSLDGNPQCFECDLKQEEEGGLVIEMPESFFDVIWK